MRMQKIWSYASAVFASFRLKAKAVPSYPEIFAGVSDIKVLLGDMESKDQALFAGIQHLSIPAACLAWREKYPDDFPATIAEIAVLPASYRLPKQAA